ncbi:CD276 antigen like [Dissostichus eleginoides]|uniref:CD276 antigen like n=1 Tax=Dissostichus eleginoides TaxID=100907 RepID=A0AAD9CIE6_DISEL|nr:CD276 antigen like [Dissostichus eleginoides]
MFAVGLQFLFLLTCGVTLGQEHDAVRMVVPEGGDALFPVSIGRDAERDYFEWKKYGNASIVIGNTTAADSGNYSCSFPRVQPPLNFYLELVVAAAPKPSVTVLTATAGEQESEDSYSYSTGAMLMVGIFPIVSLAVILAAVVALLLFTKRIKILHKKGSRLQGKYTIDMGDGLIIDLSKQRPQSDNGLIIDRSKQSDEGSALKGEEESNTGNGFPNGTNVSGAVRVVVPEGRDAVLPVSIGRNAERDLFEWRRVGPGGETLQEVFKYNTGDHYNNGQPGQSEQFKGRVSHFPAELMRGNASIVIRKTTAADAGNYTCGFPRLKPSQTFYFNLAVAATPKPSVTILTATADRALLHCEVPGASLNTKAEWQSRDGNRLDAEEERVPEKDHVFISLSVNVTRTDLYLCVVSQEDIKHRVSAQISVFISEKESEESSSTGTKVIVGIVLGVLLAVTIVAVVAFLVRAKRIKILHNKGSRLKGIYTVDMKSGSVSLSNASDDLQQLSDGVCLSVRTLRPLLSLVQTFRNLSEESGSALQREEESDLGNGFPNGDKRLLYSPLKAFLRDQLELG